MQKAPLFHRYHPTRAMSMIVRGCASDLAPGIYGSDETPGRVSHG
jgi:hypothetical protein